MNRSPQSSQSTLSLLPPQNQSYTHSVPERAWSGLCAPPVSAHCVFAPMHYEQGYAYPLIVWLHGPESNEEEVQQVMPLVSSRNFVAIAPRGLHQSERIRNGFNWGSSAADVVDVLESVENCIETAQEQFNIHPDRVFLAGYSAGGTLAMRLAMEYPQLATGAISLGGQVPRGHRLLKRINEARQMPLMLSVSPGERYSLDEVMQDLGFCHSAGFSLALRLYPEGDDLTTAMLSDVNRWVMEQFCPTAISADC